MKEHIMQLMSQPNVTQADAAKVLGVTEAYISQICSEPEFAAVLAKNRVTKLTAETAYDEQLNNTEAKALKKATEMIDYIQKPSEAANMLRVMNACKRRGATNEEQQRVINQTNNVVVLNLPQVLQEKLITNNRSEVVQIGDRPMVTMDSNFLLKKVNQSKEEGEAGGQLALDSNSKPTQEVIQQRVSNLLEEQQMKERSN